MNSDPLGKVQADDQAPHPAW